ncbi:MULTISPECIES: hypothetical protein [unclassified Bradyrhizobium]|uniref:hypothetical protein n=1 Tax=unclassified Bradyrhizobium TaxID=2631580 RepID=UPI00247A89BC|nr:MULTISPECIES: hypothetical protein [unclassified Bradyrhizobium]WGR70568.1 hypothetical protein MTX24_35460 [Bradyrhizobium sp. ISRA426]WGR75405.1 hypothetical protein MTX21_20560 [Bradyrhizobium sp. ISRA430]WGR85808.1 hypothetical protein MTX25_35145 [Bradyrhizobium sp. ISRA432]
MAAFASARRSCSNRRKLFAPRISLTPSGVTSYTAMPKPSCLDHRDGGLLAAFTAGAAGEIQIAIVRNQAAVQVRLPQHFAHSGRRLDHIGYQTQGLPVLVPVSLL